MNRKDSTKKGATTPSRQTSKRGKSSTRKQSGDPIAKFDQLMEADNSPASVRRFILDFVAALASFAGMQGGKYEQDNFAERARLAIQHVGTDAVSIALRVAIETLSRYAPAVSTHNCEDYQITQVSEESMMQAGREIASMTLHKDTPKHVREFFLGVIVNIIANTGEWDWTTDEEILRLILPKYLIHMNKLYARGIVHTLEEIAHLTMPNVEREVKQQGGAR